MPTDPVRAGSGDRANREADGRLLVEGARALQVVPAEPKQAVVGFTGWHQFPAAATADEPVTDMDQPEGRDRHRQQQDVQAGRIGELAGFQVEAVTLVVPVGGFDSVALAAPPPGLRIGGQI